MENGAEMTGYVLAYGPIENRGENMLQLDLSPTEKSLEGLTPSTAYYASLTSYNSNGQSAPVSLDFTTLEGKM